MQAKLAEIERALANQHTSAASKSSRLVPPPLTLSTSPPQHIQHPPYLSAAPGDAGMMMPMLIPTSAAGLGTPFGAPPPPPIPPTATTPPANAPTQPATLVKMAPRRVLQVPNVGRPKLFGGTIDEYVIKTGEQIPRVVLSCIRVINLYGESTEMRFK